jgi:hypothetical protein
MAFEDVRGKDGNVVISKGRTGLVMRPRTTPRNPKTAAQDSVRAALSKAAKTYKGLTSTQVQAWKNYAATITKTNPVTGKSYHPTAINAFVELAAKFLQVAPAGTVPLTPPSTSFVGDSITIGADTDPSTLIITASGANASGVTTEILIQPLANSTRNPDASQYKHLAFHAFVSATPTVNYTVPAGYYAVAYRFVKTSTGQASELVQLDVQTVTFSVAEGGRSKGKKAA